ncbi:hypothetical protein KIH74_12000 [Kineosporia sp. J2-2]|uniref:Uncharacterized protein n=1 Tax=Kineosporia corallincola TaxID=2835133 RepID=A0ABS5TEY7_9ACTN|nr:hypothetical protein [Kineosporia corallincola]MBT0769650.1 hypothetical protein [Kineosporia corallincola]
MTQRVRHDEKLRQLPAADPDGLVESIRARGIVLGLWQDRLGELLGREHDAECRALLATLQFGARPPRHLVGPPTDLLHRLRDALSKQIDLIVNSAALDPAGVEFYRSLQLDLTAIDWEQPADPIAALLERVCERVRLFYEHALGEPLHDEWPRVSWQLSRTGDGPTPHPYTADGRTQVFGRRDVLVRVRAQAGHFGPEAFLSLPQILIHEFFAHVPTRPRGDHDTGVFNAGFMDWAALVFFEAAHGALLPRAAGPSLEHGLRRHALTPGSRSGTTDDGTPIAAAARGTGHLMARRLVSWWCTHDDRLERSQVRLRVAGLAARLNIYDGGLSMADKDLFVTAMSPRRPAMARALRDYLEQPSGPLEPLLEAAGVGPGAGPDPVPDQSLDPEEPA